jgi:hypothetical protein
VNDIDHSGQQPDWRKLAVDAFNASWALMDAPNRTPEDESLLIHTAHASAYLWAQAPECTPENVERGEWLISRVYAVLNHPSPALFHAGRCLAICEQHGIGDWDIAFAHEAMARASAASGDRDGFENHYRQAQDLGGQIADADDRQLLLNDLGSGPWFGMR